MRKTYDYDSDCGMNIASTKTMAMTGPLALTLAGAITLAELRAMALIFDSDCSHGKECCP